MTNTITTSLKFLNRIGFDKSKSKEAYFAIKTFNYILFWTFLAGLVWSFLLVFIGQPQAAPYPFAASFLIPFILLHFHLTKNFERSVNFYVILLLFLPALVQLFHGGFVNSGGVVCWSVLAPVTSMAFRAKKEAQRCFIVFILVVCATLICETIFPIPHKVMSDEIIKLQFGMNLIGLVSICFFPILGFAKELKNSREKISHQNKVVYESISYAKYIQDASLRQEKEVIDHLGEDAFIYYRPKDIVSGDFYWCYKKDNIVFLVCSDCTGHGVPGAFMTLIGINHLNHIVKENKIEDPAKILASLHQKVVYSLKNSEKKIRDGMDITVCKICLESKVVEYASAMSKVKSYSAKLGKTQRQKVDKMSIGGYNSDTNFTNHKIFFEEGDCLYLLTDGYIDQFGGPKDKKFGSRRLFNLIENVGHLPMTEQRKRFTQEIEKWQGNSDQLDDITLIGIRF